MLLQYTFLSSRKPVVSVRDWSGFYSIYKQPLSDVVCQKVTHASPMLYVWPPQTFSKVAVSLNYSKQTKIIEIFSMPVDVYKHNANRICICFQWEWNGELNKLKCMWTAETKCIYKNHYDTHACIPALMHRRK